MDNDFKKILEEKEIELKKNQNEIDEGILRSKEYFKQKNKYQAPWLGIIISCLGIIPLLWLTSNPAISNQITAIIDFSVVAFLFVYLIPNHLVHF